MIQGYHVYKEVCNAEVNEELLCEREVGNRSDTFAVAVKKGTVMVGHVPQTISSICSPDGSGRPLSLLYILRILRWKYFKVDINTTSFNNVNTRA